MRERTPSELVRASRDIGVTGGTTASPPTSVGSIGDSVRVGWAATSDGKRDVRDGDTGVGNVLNPLLNLGGVSGGRGIYAENGQINPRNFMLCMGSEHT